MVITHIGGIRKMIIKRSKKEMISLTAIAVLFFVSIALVESFALEPNTDRPGMDYSNFNIDSNPSLCEQACNRDLNCQAFTYVKPGVQGSSAVCWLKNGIPTAYPDTCCDSGVKDTTPSSMLSAGVLNPSAVAGVSGTIARMPDLTITSASVTSAPIRSGDLLFIPLQITALNQGGITTEEFNVGAEGRAIDGNAYGFIYIVPGENPMPDPRYGVDVRGLAAGASKTFDGLLVLRSQPTNQALNPGTRYTITAMVDYNKDPDQFGYAWGVKESNEDNNQLVVNYPT